MARKLLPFLLVLAGISGCEEKIDPQTAARRFFEKIAAGRASEAYAGAAFAFRAQQTERGFATAAMEMGLTQFAGMTLTDPEVIEGRTAKLRVEVTTKDGRKIPLRVTLNDESGAWRIFSLKSPVDPSTGLVENPFTLVGKGAAFTDAVMQPLPDEKSVRGLVRETMLLFNETARTQNVQRFYDAAARAWQRDLTLGQLERFFQPFIEKGVTIPDPATREPVFGEPPRISSDGLLVVLGAYPGDPQTVRFKLKFLHEMPRWRLFGLEVNIHEQKPGEPAKPGPE